MTICLLTRHVTLWPWPLTVWSWTVVVHGGSRDQPCQQVWRPYAAMPIRSWVMSYNVSSWLPLKMRTRPLRMCRITWPVSTGSKTITFWNPRPRFACSLYSFYWAPTTIKGRLFSSRPMLKPLFRAKKIPSHVETGPKNDGFWEK